MAIKPPDLPPSISKRRRGRLIREWVAKLSAEERLEWERQERHKKEDAERILARSSIHAERGFTRREIRKIDWDVT